MSWPSKLTIFACLNPSSASSRRTHRSCVPTPHHAARHASSPLIARLHRDHPPVGRGDLRTRSPPFPFLLCAYRHRHHGGTTGCSRIAASVRCTVRSRCALLGGWRATALSSGYATPTPGIRVRPTSSRTTLAAPGSGRGLQRRSSRLCTRHSVCCFGDEIRHARISTGTSHADILITRIGRIFPWLRSRRSRCRRSSRSRNASSCGTDGVPLGIAVDFLLHQSREHQLDLSLTQRGVPARDESRTCGRCRRSASVSRGIQPPRVPCRQLGLRAWQIDFGWYVLRTLRARRLSGT